MSMSDFNQGQNVQSAFPKVTKAEVVELSKAVALAEEKYRNICLQNMPADPVGRVEAKASMRMERDAFNYAKAQYDRAFDAWARGGYQE